MPLNEDCWLNINGIDPRYAGTNYISAISEYVKMWTGEGFVVILDLHWTAAGGEKATGQKPMPDADHSVAMWRSVAETFKGNSKVVFEVFNEPYPDNNNWDSTEAWRCWRDGGSCNGVNYKVPCSKHRGLAIGNYEGSDHIRSCNPSLSIPNI